MTYTDINLPLKLHLLPCVDLEVKNMINKYRYLR